MPPETSFDLVISRFRAGDQGAASEIFGRFVDRLIVLASRRLEARYRSKADPEDVVQSAYKSFFRRDVHSPFVLDDWDGMWSLLAKITVRKCIDRHHYWRTDRRDVAREAVAGPGPAVEAWWDAVDRGPTPFQAAALVETMEQLFNRLSPADRAIAELTLQGYTAAEVAERSECSERTVGRVLSRIRVRLGEIESAGRPD